MSGTALEINGETVSEDATVADFTAVQTANSHVGTCIAAFQFTFGTATIAYAQGQVFIATADLYAALTASSLASANITWSN